MTRAVLGNLILMWINGFVYFSEGFVDTFDSRDLEIRKYYFAALVSVLKLIIDKVVLNFI